MSSKRRQILDAAYQLFLQQGYHGTSMRQVADLAGVTPAAIYHHYAGKEELFVAVLMARVPHRALVLALESAQGDSIEALVHDALQRMLERMANEFDNLRLVFIELIEFQGRHAAAVAAEFVPQIIGFIERLQRLDGDLRTISPLLLGRAFFGLFMSYALTVALMPDIPGFEPNPDDLHAVGEIFLHGVVEAEHGHR